MQEESPYLTLPEAAEYLRVPKSTLYKWVHFEQIPVCRAGRSLRFSRSALDSWLQEQQAPRRISSPSRFERVQAHWKSRSLTTEHTGYESPKPLFSKGEC